jgi:nicotinamidase-related amidase
MDYQLRQRDITNVVMAGMTANTCLESTTRYAYDLYVLKLARFYERS